jgi:hypothetical protein
MNIGKPCSMSDEPFALHRAVIFSVIRQCLPQYLVVQLFVRYQVLQTQIFITGCSGIELIVELVRTQRQSIEINQERGAVFEKFLQNPVGLVPFDITVGSDSAKFSFSAEYATIADSKGIRYGRSCTKTVRCPLLRQ